MFCYSHNDRRSDFSCSMFCTSLSPSFFLCYCVDIITLPLCIEEFELNTGIHKSLALLLTICCYYLHVQSLFFSAIPGHKDIHIALLNLNVLILTNRRNLTGGDVMG